MDTIEFKTTGSGAVLRGRFVEASGTDEAAPVIMMLTGDGPKGTKSLSWVNMPPKLAEVGISSWLFDFEGLGYSDGQRRTLTLSKGIDDLGAAYDYLTTTVGIEASRIVTFASSFGATVLLCSPAVANSLGSIGLKSPAAFLADAYYREIGSEKFDEWRARGYLADNGYDFDVLLDCLKHNAYAGAMQITTPCLITQGDADEVIPVQQTKYLYECLASKNKRLEVFQGSGHGYSEDGAWDRMAEMFVKWFRETLSE